MDPTPTCEKGAVAVHYHLESPFGLHADKGRRG